MATINKDEVMKSSKWIRFFFMAAYIAIVYAIVVPLLIFIVTIQFLFHLFSGSHSPQLEKVSDWLINFLGECLIFLTYKTEQRPFPFNAEEVEASGENVVESSSEDLVEAEDDSLEDGEPEVSKSS